MSFNYGDMALTASDLISEFGAAATITRTNAGQYDAEAGVSTPETVTTQNVTAVCIDYAAEFIDGSIIIRGDKQVFLSPKGFTAPAAGDKFTWQGTEYSVIAVTPLSPAGTVVLYELQARR